MVINRPAPVDLITSSAAEVRMSVRWTKRPQNLCRSCGYSWYPRGKNRSLECPNCGSGDVELAIEALLRALGYLIAAPFILAALLIRGLIGFVRCLVRWIGIGATELTEVSAPARSMALDWAVHAAKNGWSRFLFVIHWILSVKDDVLADGERDVNPMGLLIKLVIIEALLMGTIILAIESVRAIRRG